MEQRRQSRISLAENCSKPDENGGKSTRGFPRKLGRAVGFEAEGEALAPDPGKEQDF
jgi:hypothetical protein